MEVALRFLSLTSKITIALGITLGLYFYPVKADYGGTLYDYILKANLMLLEGKTVELDGVCASACAVYLIVGCVKPGVSLGFHSPYNGPPEAVEKARHDLAHHLPPKMSKWYLDGPAYSKEGVWLNYEQAVALGARTC